MAERKTYAVFLTDGRWGRTSSLAKAKMMIDRYGGKIYSMSYSMGKGPWDAPTFRHAGDLVPYTPKKTGMKLHKSRKK